MGSETIVQKVEGIAMHWVENPGTSAEFNRNWFEGRKTGEHGYGSAHYIVDSSGIIQCIPDDEIAFHVGAGPFPSKRYTDNARRTFTVYPSARLIGIELCHPSWDGHFEPEVLWQSAWLAAGLCTKYDLEPFFNIWRHYDITGKDCPKYWVKNYVEYGNWKRRIVHAYEYLRKLKKGEQ